MVETMNKKGFVKELQKELNYDEEKCILINAIIENSSLFGKKSKEKIISDLMTQFDIENSEAEKIYEVSMNIITTEIKNKVKHPFKSQKEKD